MNNAASGKNVMVFRNSISGFNKDDVNSYILRMNRDFKEKELDFKDELENLQRQLNINETESEQQLAEKSAKIAELEAQIKVLESAHTEDSEIAIETLKSDLAQSAKKASGSEKIIVEQRDLIEKMQHDYDNLASAKSAVDETAKILSKQLKEAMDANESESGEVAEKSRRYDQISRQIGDIVINANKTSDEIIERANDRADRIVNAAEEEADTRKKYISDTSEQILTKFSFDLHTVSDQCVSELSTTLNELQYDSAALAAEFDKRNRLMAEKIAAYKNSLADALKAELVLLDGKISQ